LLHVPFYWKGDRLSSLSSRTEPPAHRCRNTRRQYCTRQFYHPLRAVKVGVRTLPVPERPAGFCPCHVLPRSFCSYRKGNSCSYPSRVKSSDNRVPTKRSSMPSIEARGQPGHPRWVPGRDNEQHEFRLVLVSVPVARERPLLVSAQIHHVHSPVVKDQSTPCYRYNLRVDVALTGNQPSPGRPAEWNTERFCRLFPDTCVSVPAALTRGFLRYQEVDRRHTLLFGKAIEFTPVKARSPSLFPTSAVSNVQMPGSARIIANVPVRDSPYVCP
jgi:hypothetical protein